MKNIHVLPTVKPSKIGQYIFDKFFHFNPFFYELENESVIPQNLYITSEGEIKEGDWFIRDGSIHKCFRVHKTDIEFLTSIDSVYCGSNTFWSKEFCKKIILTTDTDLISDGVQAIPDEFLEWFVHNPNCEWVEIEKYFHEVGDAYDYEIIIPKQDIFQEMNDFMFNSKQETLEEFIDKVNIPADFDQFTFDEGIRVGAKWHQERSYSEEEVRKLFNQYKEYFSIYRNSQILNVEFDEWFETYKKK